MPYDSTHRFLLRTVASQSAMSLESIKKYLIQKTGNNQINLPGLMKELNDKIKPFKQELKIVKDEISSEEMVVYLSLGYDDASKSQNIFSAVALEYFRLLMGEIMSTDAREISEITAINLRNNVKVNNRLLNINDAQRYLNTWCRMKYLAHEDKNFALGVRAIHEFEAYFRQNMDGAENMKCCICMSIVFRGYNCPYCPKTIHSRCLDVHLKKSKTWPCCKSNYLDSDIEGLRGQNSRSAEISRVTTQLESTQLMQETSAALSSEDSPEEMENDDVDMERPRKRMRLCR